MTKRIKLGYFKELNYTKKYDSFEEFYEENKPEIYKSVVEIFEEFKTSKNKTLTLGLGAIITGMNWSTDLTLHKDQWFILKRDVLPFFEENEDYEICNRIMKLYKELVN